MHFCNVLQFSDIFLGVRLVVDFDLTRSQRMTGVREIDAVGRMGKDGDYFFRLSLP
jgi:hypothetical protein